MPNPEKYGDVRARAGAPRLVRQAAAGPAAQPLLHRTSGPPLLQLLIPVLQVLDEDGALYLQREQVEGALRAPAYRLLERPTVALDSRRVLDVDSATAELEVFGGVLSTTDSGLHEAAAVSQQVERLARPPHHAEVELPVCDQRLHGADAGRAVLADGADERQAGALEPLLGKLRQLGRCFCELSPVHGAIMHQRVRRRGWSRPLAAGHGSNDQKRLCASRDRFWQRGIRGFVRQVQ